MNDLISRQMVIDKINERQRKLIYCFGFENDAVKIMDIAKSIITAIPSVQSEIIRCKDCKYMIDTGDDLMCDNTKGWVVATTSDFGCVLAERRTDG